MNNAYYYIKKTVNNSGEFGLTIEKYNYKGSQSTLQWENQTLPVQKNSFEITGALLESGTLYFAGYYINQLDNHLSPGSASGFVASIDDKGNIKNFLNINPLVDSAQSYAGVESIVFENGVIKVTGRTDAGLSVEGQILQPVSATDKFTFIASQSLNIINNVIITPLSNESSTVQNNLLSTKHSLSMLKDGIGANFINWFQWGAFDYFLDDIFNSILPQDPDPYMEEIGQINAKLDQISHKLDIINQKIDVLTRDYYKTYSRIIENNIDIFSLDAQGKYFVLKSQNDNFISHLNYAIPSGGNLESVTVDNVINSPSAMVYFNSLNENSEQSYITYRNTFEKYISTMFAIDKEMHDSALNDFQATNLGKNEFNLVSYLDGYNEALMRNYALILKQAQQFEDISNTYLQVATKNPDTFIGWTLGGVNYTDAQNITHYINSNNTQEENRFILHKYIKNIIQNSFNFTNALLYTDSFDIKSPESGPWAITFESGYYPKRVIGELSLVPPADGGFAPLVQPYDHACELYVWKGLSKLNSFESGVFGGGTMTARCNAGGSQQLFSFNTNEPKHPGNGIAFYYGPGALNDGRMYGKLETRDIDNNTLSNYLNNIKDNSWNSDSNAWLFQGYNDFGVVFTPGWNNYPYAHSILGVDWWPDFRQDSGHFWTNVEEFWRADQIKDQYINSFIITPSGLIDPIRIHLQQYGRGDDNTTGFKISLNCSASSIHCLSALDSTNNHLGSLCVGGEHLVADADIAGGDGSTYHHSGQFNISLDPDNKEVCK